MCALIAVVVLLLGGWFGFAGVNSSQTMVEPQIVEVAPAVEMQPTATPAEIVPTLPAAAAAAATEAVVPDQTFVCEAPLEAEDIADMLAIVGKAFQPTVWTEQIGTDSAKTTATWVANNYGAVAYLEYLHYDCGVSQEQIDAYYSPEGFDVLLSSYTSHEKTAECSADGLRLFEFNATFGGAEYLMRYWVEQTSPTRVAGLMLVFPWYQSSKLDGFAARLFPQLPGCTAAG